jgi:hypothetical protein
MRRLAERRLVARFWASSTSHPLEHTTSALLQMKMLCTSFTLLRMSLQSYPVACCVPQIIIFLNMFLKTLLSVLWSRACMLHCAVPEHDAEIVD